MQQPQPLERGQHIRGASAHRAASSLPWACVEGKQGTSHARRCPFSLCTDDWWAREVKNADVLCELQRR